MAKDFAFLFYVNDWAGGTQWMNRLQKGAYIDLLLFQVNNTSFTLDEVKMILGSDFNDTWPVLMRKFVHENGQYYNEKMRKVLESRQKFTTSRRENRLGKLKKKTRKTLVKQVGNENEIVKEDVFISYCKEILKEKFAPLEFSLRAKYESWVENGWRDGHDHPIKKWKTKIKNTIPFLKPEYQKQSVPSPHKWVQPTDEEYKNQTL